MISSDRVSPSFLLLELPSFPARRIRAIMGNLEDPWQRSNRQGSKPRCDPGSASKMWYRRIAVAPFLHSAHKRRCPFSHSGDNVITLTRMQATQRPCIWVCNLGRYLTPTSLDWLFICVCVCVYLWTDDGVGDFLPLMRGGLQRSFAAPR